MDLKDAPLRTKPSTRQRIISSVLVVAALAALGGLAWYLTRPDTAPPAGARAGPRPPNGAGPGAGSGFTPTTTVGVANVEAVDLPVVLDALGTVVPAATVTVRPQVGGVLQKILFNEGDTVRAGQVLGIIDSRQFDMALMQASGTRQRDEAQLASARVTLERFKTLLAQDSIARQEVDTQTALVKQLEGTVTSDRAAEGTARLNLGYSKIVAPISGRIGLRAVDVGNIVNTGDAAGIAVITQVTPIDVQFSVPQDQVAEVLRRSANNATLPVTALDRNRTTTLGTGRFSTLDNQIDLQTGTVRAKARFTNDALALFPNQFVNVRLLLRTVAGALTIPVSALRHGTSGDYVFVVDRTTRVASLRPVTVGQATSDRVEITKGLTLGEQVITEGADRVKDGAKVTLPGDKPVGAARAAGAAAAPSPAGPVGPNNDGKKKRPPAAAQ